MEQLVAKHCYVSEKAFRPEVTFRGNSQLCAVSFNPRDQHCLAGGSINGCIAIWDVRKGSAPVESTPIDVGHRESISSLIWSNSKAGGEFFSTAPDGQVGAFSVLIKLNP